MTTTIKQLQNMPVGQKWGGETFTIKTAKKTWQTKGFNLASADIWWHQVILVDSSDDEMPADVKIGTYTPLHSGWEIKIIVAEVKEAEYLGKDRKKLVVDQFTIPTQTMDEFQSKQDEIDRDVKLIVRSKIKCWQVGGYLSQQGITPHDAKLFAKSKELDEIVDAIIGE